MAKKTKGGIEIIENPDALQEQLSKSQEFANKNKNLLIGVLTVFVLIIGGIFFFQIYKGNQERDAQEQLFPAVFFFEKDSLDKALYGDGNFTDGFVSIADEYGITQAGNLAKFYAGASFMQKGEFDKAIEYLQSFSADDIVLQGRAYALIGDAYAEKGDLENASRYYIDAANYNANKNFSPYYLMKAGLVYEKKGNWRAAAEIYQKIVDEFPEATEINDAKKYLARARAVENL